MTVLSMGTYATTAASVRRVMGVQPMLNTASATRFHAMSAMADTENGVFGSDIVGGKNKVDREVTPFLIHLCLRIGSKSS